MHKSRCVSEGVPRPQCFTDLLVALSHTLDLEKVEVMVEEFITASSTIEPA